jgi:hypothetical protein
MARAGSKGKWGWLSCNQTQTTNDVSHAAVQDSGLLFCSTRLQHFWFQIFWTNMIIIHFYIYYRLTLGLLDPLYMKVTCSFKTLEISNPATQLNNPEDLNPQYELGWWVQPEAGCESPSSCPWELESRRHFPKGSIVTALVGADIHGPSMSFSQPLEPEDRPNICTVTHYVQGVHKKHN